MSHSKILRIFDVDGVLVESEYANFVSLKKVANDFDMDLTKAEDLMLGPIPTTEKLKYLEQKYARSFSHDEVQSFFKSKFDYLKENFSHISINPHARLTIKKFFDRGDIIAIVSNARTEYINIIVDLLGIEEFVDIYLGNDSGFRTKPNPDMFLWLARKYLLKPEQCYIYEDCPKNVELVQKVGFRPVIIKSFDDLRNVD